MDFRVLFAQLKRRRRMFLLDDRYASLVAFIEGCNAATGQRLLKGFGDWVSQRVLGRGCSLHWSLVVAARRIPEILDGGMLLDDLPSELQGEVADDLFGLLDEFLAEAPGMRFDRPEFG